MDSEQISLEIDPRQALQAISQVNQGLDGFEAQGAKNVQAVRRSFEALAENLIRVNDRQYASMERMLRSIEKQATAYGKTGVERLVAERDRLIKRYEGEREAVDRLTAAYAKMIAVEARGNSGAGSGFNARYALLGAKDIFEGRGTYAIAEAANELTRLNGAALGLGLVAAALGGIALAGISAAKSLGEFAVETRNIEARTGFSAKEVGQFGFAAKMAGQDVSIFERMMKGLVQASEEGGGKVDKAAESLKRMGIDLRTVTGDLKPTSQVMLEIAVALNKLPEGVQRDAAAMDLFKRAGIEAIPVISSLTENVKRAKELGLGATEEDLRRWDRYHQQVTEAGVLWDQFARRIKEPLAAVVTFLFRDRAGNEYSLQDLAERGVNLGQWTPRSQASKDADLRKQGFGAMVDQRNRWNAAIATDDALDYTAKIEARQRGDAAVKAFEQSQGLEGRLKRAEEAFGSMAKPTIGVSSVDDVGKFAAAEKSVQTLKDQIALTKQAAEQLKDFHRQALEYTKRGDEAEMDAQAKILYQRDQLIAQAKGLKGAEADIAAIRRSADEQFSAVSAKDWMKFEDYDSKRQLEDVKKHGVIGEPSKPQLKEWEEGFSAQDRINALNLQSQRDLLNRDASHAMRLVELGGDTGMDAIAKGYQIRIQLAEQLAGVEYKRISEQGDFAKRQIDSAEALRDINKQIAEAEDEAILKRAQLIHQQHEAIAKPAEGLFSTLLTSPRQFGTQFRSTVRSAVISPIARGFGDFASNALHPLIYGQDGQGGLAGLFGGLFGGKSKDPAAMATDQNTQALIANRSAILALTMMMAAGSAFAGGGLTARSPGFAASLLGVPALSVAAPSFRAGPSFNAAPSLSFGGVGSSASPGVFSGNSAPFGGLPMGGDDLGSSAGNPASLITGSPSGAGGSPAATAIKGLTRSVGAGAASSFGSLQGLLGNLKGGLGNLKDKFGLNKTWSGAGIDASGAYNPGVQTGGGVAGFLSSQGAAQLEVGAGLPLATAGILGQRRGTLGGIAESAGGAAMVGAGIGTMIFPGVGTLLGAGIGALVGLGIGLGEKVFGVESPQTEAKRLVKQLYHVSIDNQMAQSIVQIAQQKYSGHVSIAVRDPDIRKEIELYAAGTGQHAPLSQTTPRAGYLAESGGKLYQTAGYQFGNAYTYASGLPTQGPSGGTWGGSSVVLNVNGQSAADLLEGRVASVVTPQYTQDQYSASLAGSYGRTTNAAGLSQPGLIIS